MLPQYFDTLREPARLALQFLSDWWYLLVPALLTVISLEGWEKYVKERWWRDMDYVYIALNVPPEMEKSPKFMDQFFAAMFGLQSVGSWSDRFWMGRQQLFLSLEMVGVGGIIKFVIRTPKQMRDYVESQLYAAYPEAEIEEVEDYTQIFNWQILDKEMAMFGAELTPTSDKPYPIRTYEEFDDEQAGVLMDPVAGAAEIFTGLYPGECAWIQILASPSQLQPHYKRVLKHVDKVFKREEEAVSILPKIPLLNELLDTVQYVVTKAPGAIFEPPEGDHKKEHKEMEMEPVINLSPGEREVLESMEENAAKVTYDCKIRVLYAAPKDAARIDSIASALFGVFWQLAALDKNGLKPHKKYWTKIDYFFPKIRVRRRKKVFWEKYQHRDFIKGGKSFVLSSAELATIFHPPSMAVKAPYMNRIESRKGEPPHNLPVV